MLNLFKRKQEKDKEGKNEIVNQTDIISVSDLKQHVVDAYEIEKKLKQDNNTLTEKLNDLTESYENLKKKYGVLEVVADEKREESIKTKRELDILSREKEMDSESHNKKIKILKDEINDLKIKLKTFEQKEPTMTISEVNKQTNEFIEKLSVELSNSITEHKGNLSKEKAIFITSELLEKYKH